MDNIETKTKKFNLYPLKKGKRFLVFLMDYLITFFFAFALYTVAAVPISEQITNMEVRRSESILAREERNDILYQYNIINKQNASSSLEENMLYTFNQYARYLADMPLKEANPDVFYNYFISIRHINEEDYISLVAQSDTNTLLDIDKTNNVFTLKSETKALFQEAFIEGNDFTASGKKIYDKLYSTYFLNMYSLVLNDIKVNDLVNKDSHNIATYNMLQNVVDDYVSFFKNTVVVDVYISFFLASIISYLIIPLINKNGKTIAMIFMRVDALDKNKLLLRNKKQIILYSSLNLLSNVSMVMFLPLASVGISLIFDLVSIVPISLVSFILLVVSLFFLLFGEYNQTLFDKISNTIYVTNDSLEDLYAVKGIER